MYLTGVCLRRTVVLAAALTVVCGVGGCRRADPEDKPAPSRGEAATPADPLEPPARPKIVALGDSLTAGLGLLESQAYPTVLQQKINAEGYAFAVVNAGVSGDTTAGGLRRLDWSLEGDVRVLVVALGANDGLRGLSVGEMKQNLQTIIERAKARGIVVVLAGMEAPPNFGQEYAVAFRQAFRDVALEERVIFIPFLLEGVAGHSALNQSDGIHPNPEGAAKVADTVWNALRPVLDQMTGAS